MMYKCTEVYKLKQSEKSIHIFIIKLNKIFLKIELRMLA